MRRRLLQARTGRIAALLAASALLVLAVAVLAPLQRRPYVHIHWSNNGPPPTYIYPKTSRFAVSWELARTLEPEVAGRSQQFQDRIAIDPADIQARLQGCGATSTMHRITVQSSGFPFRCMRATRVEVYCSTAPQPYTSHKHSLHISALDWREMFRWSSIYHKIGEFSLIPLAVIPIPFAANVAAFASVLGLPWFFKSLRSLRRRRAGRCMRCAYPVEPATMARCPECGLALPE